MLHRPRVVYLESDPFQAQLTRRGFDMHRIDVRHVLRQEDALREVRRDSPDVVLFDWAQPGLDALMFCRAIRAHARVAVMVVSHKASDADRVFVLETVGADDFVPKPASLRELVARIRAHARRQRGAVGPPRTRLRFGWLELDSATMEVTLEGKPIVLTTSEFWLLLALARRAGSVLTREALQQDVHGACDIAFERSIDVAVSRLRNKLERDPRKPRRLKTVRGVGYVLITTQEKAAV